MMLLPEVWGNCWRCGRTLAQDRCAACGAFPEQDPLLGMRAGSNARLSKHLLTLPDAVLYCTATASRCCASRT
jgi:hypothetical protein